MKKYIIVLFNLLFQIANAQFNYPATKEIPVTDDYFGTKVVDNYQWLENFNSDEVQSWFKAQGNFTDSIIDRIHGRAALLKRIKQIQAMGGDNYGIIVQHNNTYYYQKTLKHENIAKLYTRQLPDGSEQLLFDPQTLGKGSQLTNFVIDDAGTKMALLLSKDGAEACAIRIMDINSKTLLDDVLQPVWSEFPFSFVRNSTALLYTKMNTTDITSDDLMKNMQACLHNIGAGEDDKVLASCKENSELNLLPEKFPYTYLSNDRKYIFLVAGSVRLDQPIFFAPCAELTNNKINWKPLIGYPHEISEIVTIGDQLFFLSHKNAPNFKIGVTNILKPDFDNAKIIVPEGKGVIRSLQGSKDFIFYAKSNGMFVEKYELEITNYTSKKILLPGGVNGSDVLNANQGNNLLMWNNNWLTPYTVYEYDASNKSLTKSEWFDMSGNYPDFSKDFAVQEVEVKSYDGVMVPLSIIYPKNIKYDGSAPCILNGYGAYGSVSQPNFIDFGAALLEQGCCIAIAHVRGGGEKGETWHKAGMKATKQNTWKDFIACSEYLIDKKFTSPQKLIGRGVSMGGVLIGRAITERPDLFAVAIAEVGITNTLRLELTPNGANQIGEIGTIKNKTDAKYLIEMDAQSKIKKGVKYPAVFVRCGMNDARVVPWMPAKFATAFQNSSTSGKLAVLYVNYHNGHFTEDMDVINKEYCDRISFALWQVGHQNFVLN